MILVFSSYSTFLLRVKRILINKRLSSYITIRILTMKVHSQIKLVFMKSMNMYIWGIGTVDQLFVRSSYTQIKFSKKTKWSVVKLHLL